MPELEITLLGSLQVRLDGNVVTNPPTKKAQALLAYLAVEANTVHARERLALLLWPDQPKEKAFDSLRQTLHLLRKTILPVYLHATRLDVQFNPHADYHLDVAIFTMLMEACHRHQHTHPSACSECLKRYQQATTLYGGDFLEHFVLSAASDEFGEWALLKREWLQRAALTALYHLTDHDEQQGHYDQASLHAWRQIELDPPREEAHQQLMRALALSGQRSEALAQYESCRRILAEAVDAAPAAETTALYEQIRSGELRAPIYDLRAGPTSEPITNPIPHNLPAQVAPLVGRKQEQDELLMLLADPAVRLVTLLGAGGIGKTHLALAVVADQLAHFPDGVYFVELAPLSSPTTLVTAIAEVVKLSLAAGNDPQQQLCAYLHPKRLLLLLDNFEHLLAGVDLVVALLQAAPGLKIITTSRARLHLQSEQLFPLDGLDYPSAEQAAPTVIAGHGAVQLFLQQARRTRLHYAPTPTDWPAIAQICRLLEGMPLGVLLAAAWLEVYTPAEIAGQIGQNLDFLEGDWQDTPDRHKSMRAVFDHSWRLLSEQERTIFRQLSIFRGGFTFAAAQSVIQATPRELMGLVDRSLVRHSQGMNADGRFELHELVRQYAAKKLAEDADTEVMARNHHAAFYAAFLQQQHVNMGKPHQAAALAAVDIEIENVRVAWDWTVAQGQVGLLQQAVEELNHYYNVRQRNQEGKAAFGSAIEQLEGMIAKTSQPAVTWLKLLADLLRFQAIYAWKLDDFADSERLLRSSLDIIEQLEAVGQDIYQDRAFILRELGRLTMRHDHMAAKELFEQSLVLYQAKNDQNSAVHVMNFLGEITWKLNDLSGAKHWFEQSLGILERMDDLEPRASVLTLLGVITLFEGHVAEAEQHQRAALTIVQSLGGEASHELLLLGDILVSGGKFAEGCHLFEERIRGDRGEESRAALAHAYNSLGQAYLHLGEYTQARSNVQKSLAILRDLNEPRHLGNSRLTLAQIALAEEAFVEAHELLQANIETLRSNGGSIGWPLASCTYSALAFGATAQARQNLVEALQIAMETGAFFTALVALPPLALFFLALEESARAIELYSLALQHPFVANSRWFADVAGWQIAAAAAQLPADVMENAQARGQAADLWETSSVLLQEFG